MIDRLARAIKYKMPKPLRQLVNALYYDPDSCIFRAKDVDYVVCNGFKYLPSDQLGSLVKIKGNPWLEKWLSNTRSTDIALDLGACIGSITFPLAERVKIVVADEPLYGKEVAANRELNDIDLFSLPIWSYAISTEQKWYKLSFGSKEAAVITVPFSTIVREMERQYGGIDFLKVDIEGAEWDIKPEEVLGIREIRIEFHIRRGRVKQDRQRVIEWSSYLESNGYQTDLIPGMHESSPAFKTVDYFLASKAQDS